jgi:maltose alpha-D-glucosyltransferase/alpha-amylase
VTNFLRSHDELDLGRLTPEQRQKVFEAFAPEPGMQLYDRGIRRRLASMLNDDRRRLELALSMLFSLPGTPMLQYGDEIGMGDDLELVERQCARTPMQWTSERHGGFSTAEKVVCPVISKGEFDYRKRNVADQRRDPNSLLNWSERMIRIRKECRELSWGKYQILETSASEVLALAHQWRGASLVTLHNFADRECKVQLVLSGPHTARLVDILGDQHSQADDQGVHHLTLEPYGYRWLRVGAADHALRWRDLAE